MRTFVKICGLGSPESIRAAVEAGADAIGFVFAESPRRVTPEHAARLAAAIPAGILRVAVMRHPQPEEWQQVAAALQPDWLQTEAADFSGLTLPGAIEALPVYRDVAELDTAGLARAPRALFESAASGLGRAPDWERARQLVAGSGATEIVLAGGLHPGNVAEVVMRVRPWGVDVSSGVESSPGVKDPERIRMFIAAVRRVEQQLE